MVDLVGQYQNIKSEIDSAILGVMNSGQFIKGPSVKVFESRLADYLNVKHVISCANGTDALQVALMSLDLEDGDEVILPAFTYPATVEVVALLKLKPVLVDINPTTFNIDVTKLHLAITDKTKVIMPVHLFGQCADLESIQSIIGDRNIFIVEDTAQGLGALNYFSNVENPSFAGTIGDIGTTSFFPTKNLGCFGDGGALFTNDDKLANKIRMICNHGQSKKYYHDIIGVNSRLDSMHAAILNTKLNYLSNYIKTKQRIAEKYKTGLEELNQVTLPKQSWWSTHTFHQYTIKVDPNKRDSLKIHLAEKGIPSVVYYPLPIHKQKAYEKIIHIPYELKYSEECSTSVLSLPIHTELSIEEQDYIIDCIQSFYNS